VSASVSVQATPLTYVSHMIRVQTAPCTRGVSFANCTLRSRLSPASPTVRLPRNHFTVSRATHGLLRASTMAPSRTRATAPVWRPACVWRVTARGGPDRGPTLFMPIAHQPAASHRLEVGSFDSLGAVTRGQIQDRWRSPSNFESDEAASSRSRRGQHLEIQMRPGPGIQTKSELEIQTRPDLDVQTRSALEIQTRSFLPD